MCWFDVEFHPLLGTYKQPDKHFQGHMLVQQTEFHKSFVLVFFLSMPALLSLFVSFSLKYALVLVVHHLSYLCFVHSACYTKSALFAAVPLRCSLTDCGLFCSPRLLAISFCVLFYFLQLLWYCEGLQVVLQGEEYSWG